MKFKLVRPELRKSQQGSREPGDEIIGKKVIVKRCEAADHGDNEGCVCDLLGCEVTIKKRYQTEFAGTSSYHIEGSRKCVRRAEVILPRK